MSRFTRRALYKVSPPGLTSASGSSSSSTAAHGVGRRIPVGDGKQQLGHVLAVGGARRQAAESDLGAGRQRDRGDAHRGLARAARAHRAHGDLGDAPGQRARPQPGQRQEPVGRGRQRPVAVDPFGPDVVHVGHGGRRGQPPVRLQAGVLGRHVVLGQVRVARDVERHGGRRRPGLAPGLGHRLGHQLHVEVVAHRGDVARLVRAQQVAGPPDLQVAHGDLEARAELGVLADGLAGARRPARTGRGRPGGRGRRRPAGRCGPPGPGSGAAVPGRAGRHGRRSAC